MRKNMEESMENGAKKGRDMLCLLTAEKLNSTRPFSNITEYCLGDGNAVRSYLATRGDGEAPNDISDFDLFDRLWKHVRKDKGSFIADSVVRAIDALVGYDASSMSAEEIWSRSADVLETKSGSELFSFDLASLGVAVLPFYANKALPDKIGETEIFPVICPLGTECFDISYAIRSTDYDGIASLVEGVDRVALFAGGFEFEEPNEYTARMAYEKLEAGKGLSDREKRVLASQIARIIFLNCAEAKKEVMVFLPPSPDVTSMGEYARLLGYADKVITKGYLTVTNFARDAVGLCFAASLEANEYKNITADTGICGNGCGTPDDNAAVYWGIEAFSTKRASLSSTPAFVGW